MLLYSVLCIGIFGGFFILRAIMATVFFYYILPEGDHCPDCDAPTLRIQSKGWNRTLPWFRTSWCMECGWHGFLRHGPTTGVSTVVGEAKKRERQRR